MKRIAAVLLCLLLALFSCCACAQSFSFQLCVSENPVIPHPNFLPPNPFLQLSPSVSVTVGASPLSFEVAASVLHGIPMGNLAVWQQNQRLNLKTDLLPQLYASLDSFDISRLLNALGSYAQDTSIALPPTQPYANRIQTWANNIIIQSEENTYAIYGAPLGALYSALQEQASLDSSALNAYLEQFIPPEKLQNSSPLQYLFSFLFREGLLISCDPDQPLKIIRMQGDDGMAGLEISGLISVLGVPTSVSLCSTPDSKVNLSLETASHVQNHFSLSLSCSDSILGFSLVIHHPDGSRMTFIGDGTLSSSGNDVISRHIASANVIATAGMFPREEVSSFTLRSEWTMRRWVKGFAHDLYATLEQGSFPLYTLTAQAHSLNDGYMPETAGRYSISSDGLIQSLPQLKSAIQKNLAGFHAMLSAQQ